MPSIVPELMNSHCPKMYPASQNSAQSHSFQRLMLKTTSYNKSLSARSSKQSFRTVRVSPTKHSILMTCSAFGI